jgi:hypothetical protein
MPATRLTAITATRNQAITRSTTEPTAHSRARAATATRTDAIIYPAAAPRPSSVRLLFAGQLELVEVSDELGARHVTELGRQIVEDGALGGQQEEHAR